MSVESIVARSSLSKSRPGVGLILDQMRQLTRNRDLVAVCLFSITGLLVSLWFAISYAIPAADSLVEMPW
jgi:hypothetical protein